MEGSGTTSGTYENSHRPPLLRRGPDHMPTRVDGLHRLLDARAIARIEEVRGRMSRERLRNVAPPERVDYIRILQGYRAG